MAEAVFASQIIIVVVERAPTVRALIILLIKCHPPERRSGQLYLLKFSQCQCRRIGNCFFAGDLIRLGKACYLYAASDFS